MTARVAALALSAALLAGCGNASPAPTATVTALPDPQASGSPFPLRVPHPVSIGAPDDTESAESKMMQMKAFAGCIRQQKLQYSLDTEQSAYGTWAKSWSWVSSDSGHFTVPLEVDSGNITVYCYASNLKGQFPAFAVEVKWG